MQFEIKAPRNGSIHTHANRLNLKTNHPGSIESAVLARLFEILLGPHGSVKLAEMIGAKVEELARGEVKS